MAEAGSAAVSAASLLPWHLHVQLLPARQPRSNVKGMEQTKEEPSRHEAAFCALPVEAGPG